MTIDGVKRIVNVPDIFVRFKIFDKIKQDPFSVYEFQVQDGDRIETIADRYYGSTDYAWLVMMSNDFSDMIFDLPLPQADLENYIVKKYGLAYSEIFTTVHHYIDGDGHIVDEYTGPTNPALYFPVTVYDHEFKLNEKNRKIKLISKKYLNDIVNEFRSQIQKIEESNENSRASIVSNDN